MGITWKDAAATFLAGATGAVALAHAAGWGWLASARVGIAAMLLVGVGMCATGGTADPKHPTRFTNLLAGLGIAAGALAIAGLAFGSSWLLYALAADIIVLWALTTARHATGAGTFHSHA
jgi:hypothetical protein